MSGAPRVAIVGAGVAGLTCLHVLRRAGVSVRLFEAEGRSGGRVRTYRDPAGRGDVELGAAYFHRYYRAYRTLLSDVGLRDRVVRRHSRGIAFLDGHLDGTSRDAPIPLDRHGLLRALARGRIGARDVVALGRLRRYARETCGRAVRDLMAGGGPARASARASEPRSPYAALLEMPWYAEAAARPFGELLGELTPTVAGLVRATCRKQLFQSADALDRATGGFLAGSLAVPQETLAGGMDTLPQRLESLHGECVAFGAPVTAVHADGDRWVCGLPRGDEAFDAVVLATPWPAVRRIVAVEPLAAHGATASTRAPDTVDARVLVVAGELRPRYAAHDVLYLLDEAPGLSGLTRYGALWKVGAASGLDDRALGTALDALFVAHDVVHDQRWTPGLPRRTAGAAVGEGEVARGLFVVGDHAVPCLELAVRTGAWAGHVIARRAVRERRTSGRAAAVRV